MQHQGDVLAAFQDGETRLIYARPRAGGDLWMLPDGEAVAHRAHTKAELVCPVPRCPEPDLTTVARAPKKRDGFRHLAGGGHAPESLFHLQGKQRIADWLRVNYPASTVNVEEQSDVNRTRIADVMITGRAGKRVAFEIQYSPITPEKWRERHFSYLGQGITDIWLWGHYGANLQEDRRHPGDVKLTPAQLLVAELGEPLLWFNPVLGDVGTAVERNTFIMSAVDTLPDRGTGRFLSEPLDAFTLDEDGFGSVKTRKVLADTKGRRRWEAELEAQARAATERRVAEQKARAEAARAEAARFAEQRGQAAQEWRASDQRAATLSQMGGSWPGWLSIEVANPLVVPVAQWQSEVYFRFILELAHGNRIFTDPIVTWLHKRYGIPINSRPATNQALLDWLRELSRLGIVHRGRGGYGHAITFEAVEPARLPAGRWFVGVEPPKSERFKLEEAMERRHRERLEARLAAPSPTSEPVPKPEQLTEVEQRIRVARDAALNPPPEPEFGKAAGVCVFCKRPLDAIYADLGYHWICGQSRTYRLNR